MKRKSLFFIILIVLLSPTYLFAVERTYTIIHDSVAAVVVQWTGLLNGDTGAPFPLPARPDRSVQVKGTFGTGGNCRIEGSNDISTPTYATLNDPWGTSLNITSAAIKYIPEITYQIRPNVTAGDGTTNLTVTIIFR